MGTKRVNKNTAAVVKLSEEERIKRSQNRIRKGLYDAILQARRAAAAAGASPRVILQAGESAKIEFLGMLTDESQLDYLQDRLNRFHIQARGQLVDAVYKARKAAIDAGAHVASVQQAGEDAKDAFLASLAAAAEEDPQAASNLAFLLEALNSRSGIEGICPLVNVGNSCYMNATMQLLYTIPEFKQLFTVLSKEWNTLEVAGCSETPPADIQKLYRCLNLFFAAMYRYSLLGIPMDISAIGSLTPDNNIYDEMIGILELGTYSQEDATEFIGKLLDQLFCLCSLRPLKNLFLTLHHYETLCANPAIRPVGRRDEETTLKLPITPPDVIDVQTAIDNYQTIERLQAGENQLEMCREGNQPQGKALGRQITIDVLPSTKYLMVRLERNADPRQKNKKPITLNPTIRVAEVGFRLRGAVCHIGQSAASGHYVTYLFDEEGRPISRLDDSRVNPVSGEDLLDDSAVEGEVQITSIKKGSLAACGDCKRILVTYSPGKTRTMRILGIDLTSGRIHLPNPLEVPSGTPIQLLGEADVVRAEGSIGETRSFYQSHTDKLLIGGLLLLYERIGPVGPPPAIPVVEFNLEQARARIARKTECLADIAASYGISVEELQTRVATAGGRRKTRRRRRNY